MINASVLFWIGFWNASLFTFSWIFETDLLGIFTIELSFISIKYIFLQLLTLLTYILKLLPFILSLLILTWLTKIGIVLLNLLIF